MYRVQFLMVVAVSVVVIVYYYDLLWLAGFSTTSVKSMYILRVYGGAGIAYLVWAHWATLRVSKLQATDGSLIWEAMRYGSVWNRVCFFADNIARIPGVITHWLLATLPLGIFVALSQATQKFSLAKRAEALRDYIAPATCTLFLVLLWFALFNALPYDEFRFLFPSVLLAEILFRHIASTLFRPSIAESLRQGFAHRWAPYVFFAWAALADLVSLVLLVPIVIYGLDPTRLAFTDLTSVATSLASPQRIVSTGLNLVQGNGKQGDVFFVIIAVFFFASILRFALRPTEFRQTEIERSQASTARALDKLLQGLAVEDTDVSSHLGDSKLTLMLIKAISENDFRGALQLTRSLLRGIVEPTDNEIYLVLGYYLLMTPRPPLREELVVWGVDQSIADHIICCPLLLYFSNPGGGRLGASRILGEIKEEVPLTLFPVLRPLMWQLMSYEFKSRNVGGNFDAIIGSFDQISQSATKSAVGFVHLVQAFVEFWRGLKELADGGAVWADFGRNWWARHAVQIADDMRSMESETDIVAVLPLLVQLRGVFTALDGPYASDLKNMEKRLLERLPPSKRRPATDLLLTSGLILSNQVDLLTRPDFVGTGQRH
jgi:hypothetical protein